MLTPKGDRLYKTIESRVPSDMALADVGFEEAFAVRELGSMEEARQLLDVGYRVIEKFSPNMRHLLATMATFSRMVLAMAPVTPLCPRYRLRLYILGRSIGLATRFLLGSRAIVGGHPEPAQE